MKTKDLLFCFLLLNLVLGCGSTEVGDPARNETSGQDRVNELVGTWQSNVTQTLPEGTQIVSSNTETYDSDGQFTDASVMKLVDQSNGTALVSMKGFAQGTWKIENQELRKHYTSTDVSEFSTTMPGVTKEIYVEMLQEDINKGGPKVFAIESSSTDQFVVLETKTKTRIVMDRINPFEATESNSVTPGARNDTTAQGKADTIPARKLQNYPITIDLPETAVRVDENTPLVVGTKLSCSWNSRWLPVTVLAVHDDGTVRITWDGYGENWNGDISRDCLIIDKDVLDSL